MFVHYAEVFFTEGTENRVQCSESRGVHYIEVCLQQKSMWETKNRANKRCSQHRDVTVNSMANIVRADTKLLF